MDDAELISLLNKIGKRIFVQYFDEFGSDQNLILLLQNKESFKPKATATRIANVRRIFRAGAEERALSIIAESTRVKPEAAEKARALLKRLGKRPA